MLLEKGYSFYLIVDRLRTAFFRAASGGAACREAGLTGRDGDGLSPGCLWTTPTGSPTGDPGVLLTLESGAGAEKVGVGLLILPCEAKNFSMRPRWPTEELPNLRAGKDDGCDDDRLSTDSDKQDVCETYRGLTSL